MADLDFQRRCKRNRLTLEDKIRETAEYRFHELLVTLNMQLLHFADDFAHTIFTANDEEKENADADASVLNFHLSNSVAKKFDTNKIDSSNAIKYLQVFYAEFTSEFIFDLMKI